MVDAVVDHEGLGARRVVLRVLGHDAPLEHAAVGLLLVGELEEAAVLVDLHTEVVGVPLPQGSGVLALEEDATDPGDVVGLFHGGKIGKMGEG